LRQKSALSTRADDAFDSMVPIYFMHGNARGANKSIKRLKRDLMECYGALEMRTIVTYDTLEV